MSIKCRFNETDFDDLVEKIVIRTISKLVETDKSESVKEDVKEVDDIINVAPDVINLTVSNITPKKRGRPPKDKKFLSVFEPIPV